MQLHIPRGSQEVSFCTSNTLDLLLFYSVQIKCDFWKKSQFLNDLYFPSDIQACSLQAASTLYAVSTNSGVIITQHPKKLLDFCIILPDHGNTGRSVLKACHDQQCLCSPSAKKTFLGQNKSFWGALELVEKLTPEAGEITASVKDLPGLK